MVRRRKGVCRIRIDWNKIKTEYVTTPTSYRELCAKYHVSMYALRTVGKRDGWVEEKERFNRESTANAIKSAASEAEDYGKGLYDLAKSFQTKLYKFVDEHSIEELIAAQIKPKDITGAIKDMRDIFFIKSDADMREQEARIKTLEKQVEENKDTNITVTINGGGEDYAK